MVGKPGPGPEEAHILARRQVSYSASRWKDLELCSEKSKMGKWAVVKWEEVCQVCRDLEEEPMAEGTASAKALG